jgi:hypothetical protein
MAKVEIVNTSGIPKDTRVFIDGKELPAGSIQVVDIRIRPDEIVTATIDLKVDYMDVTGELAK